MEFKKARKLARELAQNNDYWAYIYRTKNKKEKEWEVCDKKNFNSEEWYYVAKDGQVMKNETYEKIAKKMRKSGMIGIYPFSKELLYWGKIWDMIGKN